MMKDKGLSFHVCLGAGESREAAVLLLCLCCAENLGAGSMGSFALHTTIHALFCLWRAFPETLPLCSGYGKF